MHIDKAFELWNNPNEYPDREDSFKAGYRMGWEYAKAAEREKLCPQLANLSLERTKFAIGCVVEGILLLSCFLYILGSNV